jgi:DNA-binding CsgD family transcriptional regulator/tetratricopeptide (TPR) repeat protein
MLASKFEPISWREIVAVGVVANDLSAQVIARCVGIDVASAEAALASAREQGVLGPHGVDPAEAVRMVGELAGDVVAEVHAVVARYLLSCGVDRLTEAIDHARSALHLLADTELLALVDQTAQTCLSVGDYQSARTCLECTNELSTTDSASVRAQRLRKLAAALDGLGLVAEARTHLASAFQIAEFDGVADLAVGAAVDYVLPVDWYAGDRRATAQLQRAEELADTEEQIVQLRAARAMAEMRIPVPTGDTQQVAWVTRPSVAQPLADDALERSADCSDETRLLALLGWRTTHRDPQFLERRREVSAEAFDFAQRLRNPGRMVDAAVMLAVDSLESGDRSGLERVLTVMRWIADVDANPRLAWHAQTVAAGAAHLDGDLARAHAHRDRARELGISVGIPGWFGAELVLLCQELLARADADEIRSHLPDASAVAVLNPLAKVVVGLGYGIVGDRAVAEDFLRRGVRQFDPEASWLLCHTRAAELAMFIGADDIVEEMWTALVPWHDRVAVDSQSWFCDGPVSGWLAMLAHHRGDLAGCRRYLQAAVPVARGLGDVRTMARLTRLSDATGIELGTHDRPERDLTERELLVLQRVVDGWNNPQIAESMAFSRSTIRNELSVIYRKLGVSSRLEAADHALRFGLCQPPGSAAMNGAAQAVPPVVGAGICEGDHC